MALTNSSSLRLITTALCLCTSGGAAFAQDVPVDRFQPSPDQSGYISLPSTRTPGPWGVDATLWLDYGLRTLEGHSLGAGDSVPVHHRFDGTAIAQLGIMTRGALALRVPVVFVQRGDDIPGAPKLATVAAGNPAIDGRVRLLGAPVRPDGSVNDGGALGLRGIVHLPVGTEDALFADNSTRIDASVIGDLEMFGIGASAAFGYQHAFGDNEVGEYSLSDLLRLTGAFRLPLPLIARAFPGKLQESVILELELGTSAKDFFTKQVTPFEGRLAYRAMVKDFFVSLGVGTGFVNAIGSPDLRVLAAFGWSPRKHDQDGDGVPDGEDQCEHLPEDRDGFKDEDGCADDDNDGDLIVDEDDRCPMEAADVGRDEDEDGCTDR